MTALRLLPELEDALRQIPGVRAASVVTGPDAQPTEIHVLADRLKPAKQVVRDIQSLAMARYDLDIDHRIVSVVQIDDGEAPALRLAVPPLAGEDTVDLTDSAPAPVEASPRPLVEAVVVRTSHSEAEVTVTLAFGGDVFIGSASGSSAIASRPRHRGPGDPRRPRRAARHPRRRRALHRHPGRLTLGRRQCAADPGAAHRRAGALRQRRRARRRVRRGRPFGARRSQPATDRLTAPAAV